MFPLYGTLAWRGHCSGVALLWASDDVVSDWLMRDVGADARRVLVYALSHGSAEQFMFYVL